MTAPGYFPWRHWRAAVTRPSGAGRLRLDQPGNLSNRATWASPGNLDQPGQPGQPGPARATWATWASPGNLGNLGNRATWASPGNLGQPAQPGPARATWATWASPGNLGNRATWANPGNLGNWATWASPGNLGNLGNLGGERRGSGIPRVPPGPLPGLLTPRSLSHACWCHLKPRGAPREGEVGVGIHSLSHRIMGVGKDF
ncbi:hypothetical protein TURU_086893 [Turdus rufiventris]|nr:hypothetical protein TURU_086893 [Turdus rufiventris]